MGAFFRTATRGGIRAVSYTHLDVYKRQSFTTVEEGKLIMATNATFPPYEYIEGGQVAGIDAEIITAVAEKLGL